jgi:hypothetical protein
MEGTVVEAEPILAELKPLALQNFASWYHYTSMSYRDIQLYKHQPTILPSKVCILNSSRYHEFT